MSRYDGLIIPRSYSEYINKTDAATLQQAMQLSGVLSGTVAAGDNKAVKSDAVNAALAIREKIEQFRVSGVDLYVKLCEITDSFSNINGLLLFDIFCKRANFAPILVDISVAQFLSEQEYYCKALIGNVTNTYVPKLIITKTESNKYYAYVKLPSYSLTRIKHFCAAIMTAGVNIDSGETIFREILPS